MSRESIHKKFIEEVRRLGLDVNQKDFANAMGVKEPIISMYMSGKRNVALGFLKRFCEEYGISYEEIIKADQKPSQDIQLSDRELISMFLKVSDAQTVILNDIRNKMAQESTQAIIVKKLDDLAANWPVLFSRQEGGHEIVIELLKRDALVEAKGNQERAAQILAETLRRIGPKLSPEMKESIATDGHT